MGVLARADLASGPSASAPGASAHTEIDPPLSYLIYYAPYRFGQASLVICYDKARADLASAPSASAPGLSAHTESDVPNDAASCSPVRVVHLGRSTCHAISGRGGLVN